MNRPCVPHLDDQPRETAARRRRVSPVPAMTCAILLTHAMTFAQTAKLKPTPVREVENIQKEFGDKPVPGHQSPGSLQWASAYTLISMSASPLTIVPVSWGDRERNSTPEGCGIYLLEPDVATRFLPTVGSDNPPHVNRRLQCAQVEAIGTMTDPGDRPRLILIYDGRYRNDDVSFYEVLSWNDTIRRYEVGVDTPDYQDERFPKQTIAAIRKELTSSHLSSGAKK